MATQKGRNWSSGDIVTAANLSSIERGVSAVAEEYTPTTWANGNTVTAAALNNIEQGIVNAGGGGSSDFSTAEVTINATIEGSPTLVYKGFSATIQYPVGSLNPYSGGFEDFTGNVLLYQNEATIDIDAIYAEGSDEHFYVVSTATTPTTSGNATYDSENQVFIITGDCTINITMVPNI